MMNERSNDGHERSYILEMLYFLSWMVLLSNCSSFDTTFVLYSLIVLQKKPPWFLPLPVGDEYDSKILFHLIWQKEMIDWIHMLSIYDNSSLHKMMHQPYSHAQWSWMGLIGLYTNAIFNKVWFNIFVHRGMEINKRG